MLRACIFDCFGVLYVPATELYFANFPQLRDELYTLDRQSDSGSIDKPTYITTVAKLTGVSEVKTAKAFAEEFVANQPLLDYIQTTLKPQYKIGLLTNLGRGWIHDFFNQYKLDKLFDAVVISGEEGRTKPHPIVYERIAERLGVGPGECLFIDDRQINCDGAEKVGMKSCLYTDVVTFQQHIEKLLPGE